MILRQQNGIFYFQFHHLSEFPELRHGIFTRLNGESRLPYDGLNVGFNPGDVDGGVAANRRRIFACMGDADLIFVRQVHQTGILMVGKHGKNSNAPLPAGDGMITKSPENNLVIQIADCQAVLLYDPGRRVIANIHSGWRGSTGNIAGKCVGLMIKHYGCRPADILAGISPSLGPCCAEFIHYQTEIPEEYWKYRIGRDHFNFWKISADQLTGAGLRLENIEISDICTKCNPHLFYSYRQTNPTGRFAAVIGLTSNSAGGHASGNIGHQIQ